MRELITRPATREPPRRRALSGLVLLIGLFATSGANCNQWVRTYTQPRVLPESATLAQIVTVVNDNTAKVEGHSLQATQASLSIKGVPTSLRTSLALQSPNRLRLQANTPITGPELDLGSNDELFWLWVRQNKPPALFFCRHDQFAFSNARQIMPVEPEWLIEAVGLVHFNPAEPLEGPFPVHGDRVEIHSRKPSMMGDLRKITVVDQWDGTVVEQDLYTPDGKLLALSRTSRYKHDPLSGAALPHSVDVEWPTSELSFHLDVTDWVVNAIPPDNVSLWTKPEYPGYPNVDLADPHIQFLPAGAPPPVNRAAARTYPPGAAVSVPNAGQPYPPGTSIPLR
jgi:hypothetical protein